MQTPTWATKANEQLSMQLEDHVEATQRELPGKNRYGVQGVHLNPLDLFLNPLGLFLRTSILFIKLVLSAFFLRA